MPIKIYDTKTGALKMVNNQSIANYFLSTGQYSKTPPKVAAPKPAPGMFGAVANVATKALDQARQAAPKVAGAARSAATNPPNTGYDQWHASYNRGRGAASEAVRQEAERRQAQPTVPPAPGTRSVEDIMQGVLKGMQKGVTGLANEVARGTNSRASLPSSVSGSMAGFTESAAAQRGAKAMSDNDRERAERADLAARIEQSRPQLEARLREIDEQIARLQAAHGEVNADAVADARANTSAEGFAEMFRGVPMTPGNLALAGNYGSGKRSARDQGAYNAALRQLEEERSELQATLNYDGGFWSDAKAAAKGLANIAEVDKWALNIPSTIENMGLSDVYEKVRRGERLNAEEREAAQAIIASNESRQQNHELLPNAYTYGDIAAESAPFMLQFMLTGGFSGAQQAVSKAVVKGGAKALGADMATLAGKAAFLRSLPGKAVVWTGEFLGDVGAATLQSATMGMPKMANDAITRHMGQIDYATTDTGAYQIDSEGDPVFTTKRVKTDANDNPILDAQGNLQYEDTGESWSSSIYKSVMSNIIENYSERFGEHLRFMPKSWSRALPQAAKRTGQFMAKAGIHGLPGEVVEEEVGVLANQIMGVEDSLPVTALMTSAENRTAEQQRAVDSFYENQRNILGGIGLSVGLMGAGHMAIDGTGRLLYTGYTGAKKKYGYYATKRAMDSAERTARFRLDGAGRSTSAAMDEAGLGASNRWNDLRTRIDNTTNDDMKALWDEISSSEDYAPQEVAAIAQYMNALMVHRGYNLGSAATPSTPEETDDMAATAAGYSAQPEERSSIQARYDAAEEAFRKAFGIEEGVDVDNWLSQTYNTDGSSSSYMRAMDVNDPDLDPETRQTIAKYFNARSAVEGMQMRMSEEVEDQVADSNEWVKRNTFTEGAVTGVDMEGNPAKPMVVQATTKEGKQVYVVNGDLRYEDPENTYENGGSRPSPFNTKGSAAIQHNGGTLIVRDAETGELSMISDNDIEDQVEHIDAESFRESREIQIREAAAQEQARQMGEPQFQPGDQYYFVDERGNAHTAEVSVTGVQDNEGNVTPTKMVSINGMPAMPLTDAIMGYIANDMRRTRKMEIAARDSAEAAATAEQSGADVAPVTDGPAVEAPVDETPVATPATPGATGSYQLDDEVNAISDGGKPVRGKIIKVSETDGSLDVEWTDGEVGGNTVGRYTPAELDDFLARHQEATAETPAAPSNEGEASTDTVGASPVTLEYLLEGGLDVIKSTGYFLHGVAAAFERISGKIEGIRGKYLSQINDKPSEFANDTTGALQEIRDAVMAEYGQEGVDILNELIANATGFAPRVGKQMGLRIEEMNRSAQQNGPAQTPAASPVEPTKLPFTKGDVYDVQDEAGEQHSVEIVENNGDGTVQVSVNGGNTITAAADTIQEMYDRLNPPVATEAPATEATEAPVTETQAPAPETPVETATATTAPAAPETPEAPAAPEAPATIPETPVETAAAAASGSAMPLKADGNEDYRSAGVDRTIDYLEETYADDDDVDEAVNETIDANVKAAQAAVDNWEKKRPKRGVSAAANKAAMAQWKEQAAKLQDEVDFWNNVKTQRQNKRADQDIYETENRSAREISAQLGEPRSLEEAVVMAMPGYKFIWGNNPGNATKGVGAMIGANSEAERKKRVGWLGRRDSEALYPEQVAERIYENLPDKDRYDYQDVLDIVNDTLLRHHSPRAAVEAIANERASAAERNRNAEADHYEAMHEQEAHEAGFDTVEEYDAWRNAQPQTPVAENTDMPFAPMDNTGEDPFAAAPAAPAAPAVSPLDQTYNNLRSMVEAVANRGTEPTQNEVESMIDAAHELAKAWKNGAELTDEQMDFVDEVANSLRQGGYDFADIGSDVQKPEISRDGNVVRAGDNTNKRRPVKRSKPGVVANENASKVADLDAVDSFAKALGVSVEFVDHLDNADAEIEGNTVRVAMDAKRVDFNDPESLIRFLIGHELTHRMQDLSPEDYANFKSAVIRSVGKKAFDKAVAELKEVYAKQGIEISDAELQDEVTADAAGRILSDKKMFDRFAKSANGKVLEAIRKFLESIKSLFMGDTTKEKLYADMLESLAKLKASAEARVAEEVEDLMDGQSGVVFNEKGDMVADNFSGKTRFSIRTWEDGGRHALSTYLDKQVKKKIVTREEADNMLAEMDRLTAGAKEIAAGQPGSLFGQWSYELVRTKDGTNAPLLHALKKNDEYVLNIDFSTVCKKRQVLDFLMNKLIREGNIEKEHLSPADIARINQIIQKHGLEIACAICFVDSRRYNAYTFAKGFLDKFNPLVQSLAPKEEMAGFNYANNELFSNDGKFDASAVDEVVDWNTMFSKTGKTAPGLKGYQLNWKGIVDIMTRPRKDSKKKPKPSIIDEAMAEYKSGATIGSGKDMRKKTFEECLFTACNSAEETFAYYLSKYPSLRKIAKAEDFVASEGWTNIMQSNDELVKLWNIQKGAAGARANEGNTQYLSDVLKKGVNSDIFDIGGYRMQSFSDFIGHMYFDYLQAFADLAAMQLPGHAYTKEPSFVKLFGMMGMKVNMPLVFQVDSSLPNDYAGLTRDADGNLVYNFNSTVRDEKGNIVQQGQTFPPEQAFELQQDPRYTKNAGTIAVGLSREHILMMLRDPNIRMVIPYHASGLPHGVALIYNLNEVNDYTNSQNTRGKGKSLSTKEKDVMHARVDQYNFILHQLSIAENRNAAYATMQDLFVKGDASKVDMHKEYEKLYAKYSKKGAKLSLPYELSEKHEDDGFLPKAAADIYKDACEAHGYIPKFDEFADEHDYFKVLIDFAVYDSEGNYTPQEAIHFEVPDNVGEYIAETLAEDEQINADKNREADPIIDEINAYLANTELRAEQDRISAKPAKKVKDEEKAFMQQDVIGNVGDPVNVPKKRMSIRQDEDVITSESFKNWFGDWQNDPENASKVVDGSGKPLIVYHGTTTNRASAAPFTEITSGHFTDDKEFSDYYARSGGGKPYIFAVYLDIKNPLVYDFMGQNSDNAKDANGNRITTHTIVERAKREGYDGAIILNVDEYGTGIDASPDGYYYGTVTDYIPLNPSQIKSATDNNGNFDPDDPDIRFQRGSNTDETMRNDTEESQIITEMVVESIRDNAGLDIVMETQEAGQQTARRGDAEMMAVDRASDFIKNNVGKKRSGTFTVDIPSSVNRKAEQIVGHKIKEHRVDISGMNHAYNNHGENGRKITENSIPLTKEDVALAPYILCAPSRVRPGSFNGGNVTVIYEKDLSNGKVVYIEAQYGLDGDILVSKNMWADVSSKVVDARQSGAPELTSKNVILAQDAAKIRQDAETAIRNAENLQKKDSETSNLPNGTPENAEKLTSPNGTVYGWAEGNTVHLTPEGLNPNTPIHEYTHLWAKAVQAKAPKLWNNIKSLLKNTPVWEEVLNDESYADIRNDEDRVASEALSRISGTKGAIRMQEIVREYEDAKGATAKAKALDILHRLRTALDRFWKWVGQNLFDIQEFESADDVADRVLYDLVNRTDFDLKDTDGIATEFSIVTDEKEVERLESEPHEFGYRNVVLNEDGTMGSPMASKLGKKKVGRKATSGFTFDTWERSDENPDLATDDGKIDLIKPDGKSVAAVDYNPYVHIRPTLVNKQFKQAWERPNLVYVRTAYPASELTSGFKADKAKLSVGKHPWNGGELILSRWDKVVEVVPWGRVADDWMTEFGDKPINFDIIPPHLLPILTERGANIVEPHKGMSKACTDAYEKWKSEKGSGKKRRSVRQDQDVITSDPFKNWFGDWENDPDNSSKMVDEDGKPKVFYHGTNWDAMNEAPGDAVFDDRMRGTASGDNGFFGYGHYFAFTKEEAEFYGRNVLPVYLNIRNPFYFDENFGDYNGVSNYGNEKKSAEIINLARKFPELADKLSIDVWDEAGEDLGAITLSEYAELFDKIYAEKEFIVEENVDPRDSNIIRVKADPVVLESENGYRWTEYNFETELYKSGKDEDQRQAFVHYYLTQELRHQIYTDDARVVSGDPKPHVVYSLPYTHYVYESKEFTDAVKKRGYDGIVQSKHGDEAVAFDSNQIKSATDNNGEFDPNNPDIRFRDNENDSYVEQLEEATEGLREGAPIRVVKSVADIFKGFITDPRVMLPILSRYLRKGTNTPKALYIPSRNEIVVFAKNGKIATNDLHKAIVHEKTHEAIANGVISKDEVDKFYAYFREHKNSYLNRLYLEISDYYEHEDIPEELLAYTVGALASKSMRPSNEKALKEMLQRPDIADIIVKLQNSIYNEEEYDESRNREGVQSRYRSGWRRPGRKNGRGSNRSSALEVSQSNRRGNAERLREAEEEFLEARDSGKFQRKKGFPSLGHLERHLQMWQNAFGERVKFEVHRDGSEFTGRKAKAKGWFDPKDGKVHIILDNHYTERDLQRTIFHEVAAHLGLRKMFGKDFNAFLTNIYNNAEQRIQKDIDLLASRKYNGNRLVATEEYMANIAERMAGDVYHDEPSRKFWERMLRAAKDWLLTKFRSMGIDLPFKITDEDIAYVLWESYKGARYGKIGSNVFEAAEDVEMQRKLGVRNFSSSGSMTAEDVSDFKRDVTASEAFKAWFGDWQTDPENASKVVDHDGKPMVMYHGSIKGGGFTVFDKNKIGSSGAGRYEGLGFNFASSESRAGGYGNGANVYSVYLDAKHPATDQAKMPFNKFLQIFKAVETGVKRMGEGWTLTEEYGNDFSEANMRKVARQIYDYAESDADLNSQMAVPYTDNADIFHDAWKKAGFDSVIWHDKYNGNISTVVVFDPAQIKSATENNGEFDPNNPDILFRDGEEEEEETPYRPANLTEGIIDGLMKLAETHRENHQLMMDSLNAIDGQLAKLKKAMAVQRTYDRQTVNEIVGLARLLLTHKFFDNLTNGEVKRLMAAIRNATGAKDTTNSAMKLATIVAENQMRQAQNLLKAVMSVKSGKVNASGVEVMGELDINGQVAMRAFKEAMQMPLENITERLADLSDRMGSSDEAVANNASIEYGAVLMAQQYVENVTNSKAEETDLKQQIRDAKQDLDARIAELKEKHDRGEMTDEAYNEAVRTAKEAHVQYVSDTNVAILENKLERVQALRSLIANIGGMLRGSIEKAEEFRQREKERVENIHHYANSDLAGRKTNEHYKADWTHKLANWSVFRFFLKPLATFDQMLRMIGSKNVKGEGYLWNHYMRAWVKATDKEFNRFHEGCQELDKKASEIMGKKMKWSDLYSMEAKIPGTNLVFYDGGDLVSHPLTQGNMLYIYMVNKMADGRMKLRKMGITDEVVEEIEAQIDPRFIALADWVQNEFLVKKRNDYNAVHERMFGASMASIENYFPLKVLSNARVENIDVADTQNAPGMASTTTGSIIKRRRNSLALDITGTDAFSLVIEHLQQMEKWAAFAEFNRDVNTLLSYKTFRNKLQNMSSVYGAGKTLWNNFRDCARVAAGTYQPTAGNDSVDRTMMNVAKGVTAAKISFRMYTALKQFTSFPAYLSEANIFSLGKSLLTPRASWKWAMNELPMFSKRWKSRQSGDNRLDQTDMDWGFWKNKFVEALGRIGMTPNAFVDGLTVAIGSKAIYDTKLKQYLKAGYSQSEAEQRAKEDASVLVNETQQSNENAFLSPMQVDRSAVSVGLSLFRNSSMGYERQFVDAIRSLKRMLTPGYREESIDFMKLQMVRDGLDADMAEAAAEKKYNRDVFRNLVRMAIFGYVLQFTWNMAASIPYLLVGGDDDDKLKMIEEAAVHAMFGGLEGLSAGNLMSDGINKLIKGESTYGQSNEILPLLSDMSKIKNKLAKKTVEAATDIVNLLVQSGIGVNPQTITDAALAIYDASNGDLDTATEAAILVMRILSVPQENVEKVLMDAIGTKSKKGKKLTVDDIAKRYAEYKVSRNAALTEWAYSEPAREDALKKAATAFKKKYTEREKELGRK